MCLLVCLFDKSNIDHGLTRALQESLQTICSEQLASGIADPYQTKRSGYIPYINCSSVISFLLTANVWGIKSMYEHSHTIRKRTEEGGHISTSHGCREISMSIL